MKRTGIFSGSFNPIHIGHLALANWLCEFEDLDEIWFLITPQNPLKNKGILMDGALRLEMAKAAIDDYPRFRISDFEFSLPRPSYSIDTLRALEKTYPDHSFVFIVGADNWQNINQWKESEALLENYPILIYPRKDYIVSIPEGYPNVKLTEAPIIDISSTFIREAYQQGKDIRFFLPEKVRPYFKCPE